MKVRLAIGGIKRSPGHNVDVEAAVKWKLLGNRF
jgi:hypothetical protein